MTGGPRIAVDGRMLSQDQCHGVARVTVEMLRHLPRCADDRITLLLAARRSSRFDVEDLRARFDVVDVDAPVDHPYRVRELARTLRGLKAEVLFAPYHPLAPLHAPCPMVVAVHDCILEGDRRLLPSALARAAYRAKTTITLRQAARTVVPSQATAEALPAHYRWTPPTAVCRNGVGPAPRPVVDPDLPIAPGTRYILHVGSVRRHKNQRLLVDAVMGLPQDVRLVLVGHHDPRVDYRLQDNLGERVVLVDEVDDGQLDALFRNAAVFAFPSVVEGFGLPVLEAMRAQTPVVASAIPAVAEVARDAALLVSPFDVAAWTAALLRVLEEPDLAARMCQAGTAVAAASGWDAGAARLLEVLDGAAAAPPSGTR